VKSPDRSALAGHLVLEEQPLPGPGDPALVGYLDDEPEVGRTIRVTFLADGRCSEITITTRPDVQPDDLPGLTTRSVRTLRVEALRRAAMQALTTAARDQENYPGVSDLRQRFTERPGRRGRQDVDYALLVHAYTTLLGQGKPVEALATREFLSASQVRNLLSEAKRRKIMTRPGRGRAGGQLTPYGHALLTQAAAQEDDHGQH
jgi:hypothetical protein